MSTKSIITTLKPTELTTLQNAFTNRIIVVKIGAEWCGPCKFIKPTWNEWIQKASPNIIIADLDGDQDENIELIGNLRTKKMMKGIPVIFAYYGDIERDHWYIPDDSVIGGDLN